jgi:hypothetical protein
MCKIPEDLKSSEERDRTGDRVGKEGMTELKNGRKKEIKEKECVARNGREEEAIPGKARKKKEGIKKEIKSNVRRYSIQ